MDGAGLAYERTAYTGPMTSHVQPALYTLAATPKTLAHLVAEVPDPVLDRGTPGGGWSARTLLAHLRDDEYLCMRVALERLLAEDSPNVQFIDGADWEPGRNRTRDRKELLLADFALQRQASLGILNGLRPEDWERAGTTGGSRSVTVSQLVESLAEHDREHIAELERVLGETLEEVLARRARPEL
jgi:hypothetical protein